MSVENGVFAPIAQAGSKLTKRQLLFWLGQKRHPAIPLYNMIVEFDIRGEIDVPRFQHAFTQLVRASDALRSVFHEVDGTPRRVVLPREPATLEYVDLSGRPDPERELRERIARRSRQELDLATCCFDSALFKIGERRFVWWFCQHHILGDGASMGIIYRFVERRYAAAVAPNGSGWDMAGGSPQLGSVREAEAQERAYLGSRRASDDEAFWAPRRKRVLERPAYYGRPTPETAMHVERLTLDLGEARSERVREIGRSLGVSALPELGIAALFTTVLFAYLYRITGRSEQAVGTPFRNRHTPAAKDAVGCFIEVLPIQVDVAREDTFRTLFRRVHDDMMAALGRGQACIANSEAHPLFDATFNLLTERYPPFAGLPTEVTFSTGLHAFPPIDDAPGAFDRSGESLQVHCQDYAGTGRYTLWFDFHAAYFDRDQRDRAVGHFSRLLEAALQDPDTKLAEVPIVGPEERARLLREFNPAPVPDAEAVTVVSLFEKQVGISPERAAVRFHDEQLSYRELDAAATRFARALRALGVGPDVLVGVLLERSTALPAVLLGILKSGGAYVPLDPTHPTARNALVMEDAQPAVVITEPTYRDELRVPARTRVVALDELTETEACELPPPAPHDLAYVLFTSGSSGRPKGVAIEHGALANFLLSMREAPGIDAEDRVLALTTIAFDIAALELFLPLVTGATIDLVDRQTAADPTLLRDHIQARKPTLVQATPATWHMLLEAGWQGDPSLKALSGGEALSPELAKKLAPRVRELWNMYGPTETTVWSSVEHIPRDPACPITIGAPIRNTTIHVLNEALQLAPIGVPGEICIGGSGVARGYYGNRELTAARFVRDPYSEHPDARLYRTGDLGLWRSDGRLECLGRADFQVKIRGFRIELGEIESVLQDCSGVASAVVVAREDRPSDKLLAAYVVPQSQRCIDAGALRRFVQERLPAYMVPTSFTLLESLPLTPNGKIDRRALPKPNLDVVVSDDPPQSDLELRIAWIFEELLGVASVGRRDNFFELGGHSLLAAELLGKLNTLAKAPLSMGQIFQHATVAGLAELIAKGGVAEAPLVIPLNRAAPGPALFCICGIHLYRELAHSLGDAHPVYGVYLPQEERGLQAARLRGDIFSVEELATGYLEAVRRQQPRGPYCLAGVSFGGILAYEMAQQLLAAGEDVALLALFDSALPRAMRRRWLRWVIAHGRAAVQKRSLEYVTSRLRRAAGDLVSRRTRPSLTGVPPDMEFRVGVYLEATRRYDARIRAYPGRLLLFRASARDDFAGYDVDPSLGWGGLVRTLDVYHAEGTHLGILQQPGVRALADPLRIALDELFGPAANARKTTDGLET